MLSIIVEIAPANILWSNIGNKHSNQYPQHNIWQTNIKMMVCVDTLVKCILIMLILKLSTDKLSASSRPYHWHASLAVTNNLKNF